MRASEPTSRRAEVNGRKKYSKITAALEKLYLGAARQNALAHAKKKTKLLRESAIAAWIFQSEVYAQNPQTYRNQQDSTYQTDGCFKKHNGLQLACGVDQDEETVLASALFQSAPS